MAMAPKEEEALMALAPQTKEEALMALAPKQKARGEFRHTLQTRGSDAPYCRVLT